MSGLVTALATFFFFLRPQSADMSRKKGPYPFEGTWLVTLWAELAFQPRTSCRHTA